MARKAANQVPINPIMIGDLPIAKEAALATFEVLPTSTYQNSSLGKSHGNDEGTACDCHFIPGRSKPHEACGEGSNCINRLTLVECIEGDCPSRSHCQNRRFQRKEYADVTIVQTEKKGFGLRAESPIERDAFIYEYIGEVVKEGEFMKRMGRYAAEGIRHFYFMMLQKEQYIDATKKGDIGRFANHSCNPNCYVSKWFVGNKVRMGIFAKRDILKHEELTFNYNVDRYGHDAQECFCGEPNCVGYIGGKTQTDIGGMDDLYIEALGITEDVEKYSLKGTKRKKGKKLDEDYLPPMTPITEDEVPVVLQALRQSSSSNPKMLPHILTRLQMTLDQNALRGVMRLRGFSLMHSLLEDHGVTDPKITKLILSSMKSWPLVNRNKVEDSGIEEPIRPWVTSEDEELRTLAEQLLTFWAGLETAYRIPRRPMKLEEVDGEQLRFVPVTERVQKRTRAADDDDPDDTPKFKYTAVMVKPPPPPPVVERPRPPAFHGLYVPAIRTVPSKDQLADIIARATEAAETARAAEAKAAAEVEEAAEKKRLAKIRRKERAERKEKEKAKRKAKGEKPSSSVDKAAEKDKRLVKLVGEVVVKYMSQYRDQMDHDVFKKHAKELTHLIAEKEKRSSSYKEGKLTAISDEKRKKMKTFIIDYVKKLLRRKGKAASTSASGSKPSNGNGPSEPRTPEQTPDGPTSASPVDADASGEGPTATYGSDAEDNDDGSNADSDDDAMSIDGKSDVTVETPPRPPT